MTTHALTTLTPTSADPTTLPAADRRPAPDTRLVWAAVAAAAIFAIYIGLTWGFAATWWGDYGRWLHEIDRRAHGEVPYKDFNWHFPPLAIETFGAAARLAGSDVLVVQSLGAVICLGIFVVFVGLARALVVQPIVPVVIASLFLAVAYSTVASESLAVGMYNPGIPLGGLLLLTAVLTYLRAARQPSPAGVTALGVLLALAVLAKQDFWLPSACVFMFAAFGLRHTPRLLALPAGSCAGVLAVFIGSVVSRAGWDNFLVGLDMKGISLVRETVGRGFPSWERLTVQAILAATVFLFFVACCRAAGASLGVDLRRLTRWLVVAVVALAGVYVVFSIRHVTAAEPLGPEETLDETRRALDPAAPLPRLVAGSLGHLAKQLRLQGWPLIFAPAALAWLLVRWRAIGDSALRGRLLFLLCLCVSARCRRLFEHVEWYHFLLELPAAALLAECLTGRHAVGVNRRFFWGLAVAGAVAFADWTLGPATNLPVIGRPPWGQATAVVTPHGRIWVPAEDARAFHEVIALLDRADPSGTAPVFATNYQGAWAYFSGRRNSTPLTEGFSLSSHNPETVLADLLAEQPKALVIDTAGFHHKLGFPVPAVDLSRWELRYRESFRTRVDGPLYDRLLSHYEPVGSARGRFETWTVHRFKQGTGSP